MTAIGYRDDFDGSALRLLARRTKNGPQARRLLALGEIYDGGWRTDAARIGGVTLQSVRDWVLRFNAKGLAALIDLKARQTCAQSRSPAPAKVCPRCSKRIP